MIKHLVVAAAACCLYADGALAEPEKPPRHNPEWTDHNDHDPGVTGAKSASSTSKLAIQSKSVPVESVNPELSRIVVLCATEKEEQFEKEWRQYVNKNRLEGTKLKETIAWVSEEAAEQRKQGPGEAESAESDEAWMEQRRQFMSEVADKALNPVR